jgi:hypothetical protein
VDSKSAINCMKRINLLGSTSDTRMPNVSLGSSLCLHLDISRTNKSTRLSMSLCNILNRRDFIVFDPSKHVY